MVEDNEMHMETESEDGGVPLSGLESSDEIESDHESAPTSPSQSPAHSAISQAAVPQASSASAVPISAAEGVTLLQSHEPQTSQSVQPPGTSLPSHLSGLQDLSTHPPAVSPVWPHSNDESFAQALSGELLNLHTMSNTPPEHVTHSSSTALSTPQAHPVAVNHMQHSNLQGEVYEPDLSIEPPAPDLDEEPMPYDVTFTEYLPENMLMPDTLSFPELTEAFGSDFLTQPLGSSQAHILGDADHEDLQEEYAEIWDETEHSIKNLHCEGFFSYWKTMLAYGIHGYPKISAKARNVRKGKPRVKVLAEDLISSNNSDPPDLQSIHWERFQTTKEAAREVRRMTYSNHINPTEYQQAPQGVSNNGDFGTKAYKMKFSEETIPSFDKHFDFRETNMRFQSYIPHFQLRHNLFASSKNALFYTRRPVRGYGYGAYDHEGNSKIDARINCFNPETSTDECVMNFCKRIDRDAPEVFRPSTLTAGNGVLVVGSFESAYAMKSLSADFESKPTMGIITVGGMDASTNHIQNYLDRVGGLPQVAFSSNDRTIRVLDCTTNKFTKVHRFPYPVNTSAISPDGRLRLLVGDDCLPIVANAETGEHISNLRGHTNFGFACDWAPDGVTMATGHQDGFVRVWDARNWSQSTHAIPMEMAGSRTLQFSPLGTGKRLLIIAEPGDFVHIVDAQTFKSKQVIDFFGEIAGIAMPPDGSALYIANQDRAYGGLMEFQRSGDGFSRVSDDQIPGQRPAIDVDPDHWKSIKESLSSEDGTKVHEQDREWFKQHTWGPPSFDWLPDDELYDDPRRLLSRAQRGRRNLGLSELII